MELFETLKSGFESRKNYLMGKRFFLVKDYFVGSNYLVDLGTANFLFGGKDEVTGDLTDYLYCIEFLQEGGFKSNLIYEQQTQTPILLFSVDDPVYKKLSTRFTPGLSQRCIDYRNEIRQGIDAQTRHKTKEELDKGRSVRIIGCYANLETAKKDFVKVMQKEQEKGHPQKDNSLKRTCEPEEMIIVEHNFLKVPADFKGRVVCSPLTREL